MSTYGHGAHPRSRGENDHRVRLREHDHGSSPLTRGKPADRALSGKWSGLIPAHAGKTPPTFGRSCVGAGSSPLTRGKRPADGVHC